MGEVWLARDGELDQDVVTKIVSPDSSTATIELLRHECRNARRLSHPNIVRVFDFHQCDGVSFITMEYVDGESIESLRGGAFEVIVEALVPLAEALDHAHKAGVVHRDIKASNVLLNGAGGPLLMDFGIAGVLHPGEGDLLLSGGGSKYSMSPQQQAGEPPRPADDIYGLGALAYQLLSGHRPPWADRGEERIQGQEQELLDPLRAAPPQLQALVRAMLARSPADRPADMAEVRSDLQRIAAELSVTETLTPEIRPPSVRLTPPPKIEAPRLRLGRESAEASESRLRLWMTLAVFVVLGTFVVGVFMLLPGWVQRRGEREVVAANESSPVAEASEVETKELVVVGGLPAEPSVDSEKGDAQLDSVTQPPSSAFFEDRVAESDAAMQTVEEREAREIERPAPATRQSDVEFRQSMSEGLKALATGDAARAKQAFQHALSVSPGSPEAVDGLRRAEENLRLTAISEHRPRASEFEQKEDWQAALKEYDAVLGLDPTIRFAQEGKARTEVRSKLAEQLDLHIAHPERLATDPVLDSARQLLSQARAMEPSGPVLRRQMATLAELIAIATTPIRVELISDNLTEVTVYRVGRLGRFAQHGLELRPGTYTVVGSRAGYRDVRRRLTVSPHQESKPLLVRCEEEI